MQTKRSEHGEQVVVIQWAERLQGRYKSLENLYAIPNGAKKSKHMAVWFQQEGLRSGVPDLCLAWPLPHKDFSQLYVYCGLYIEMKVKPNTVSDAQQAWGKRLIRAGYMWMVCWNAQEAVTAIGKWLSMEPAEYTIS